MFPAVLGSSALLLQKAAVLSRIFHSTVFVLSRRKVQSDSQYYHENTVWKSGNSTNIPFLYSWFFFPVKQNPFLSHSNWSVSQNQVLAPSLRDTLVKPWVSIKRGKFRRDPAWEGECHFLLFKHFSQLHCCRNTLLYAQATHFTGSADSFK